MLTTTNNSENIWFSHISKVSLFSEYPNRHPIRNSFIERSESELELRRRLGNSVHKILDNNERSAVDKSFVGSRQQKPPVQ